MGLPSLASESGAAKIFDVGINDRLPAGQLLLLGLQNVFGMTGMFVFPGLLGRSFNLPAERIAYLYGMTFAVCGVITILQSVLLLRLPIIQGPYAGNFAALLAVGHLQSGGLGAAYGSFLVASLAWCVLAAPIRGFSFVGLFARFLRAPLISGMIVLLTIIQIVNVALPNWIGLPASAGFARVNVLAGAVAVAVLIAVTLWCKPAVRRAAILLGLAAGTLCYALFRPISFAAVANAPLVVTPQWFPFGFGVQTRAGADLPAGADSGGHGLDGDVPDGCGLGRGAAYGCADVARRIGYGHWIGFGGDRRRIQHHRVSR